MAIRLALAGEWAAGPDPELLRRSAPLVFSRVDASFLNRLWDGRRVWIVDYEFARWKDRVIDLADLLEVDAATAILFRRAHRPRASEQDSTWFVGHFELTAEERRRYLAARRWLNRHFTLRYRHREYPKRPERRGPPGPRRSRSGSPRTSSAPAPCCTSRSSSRTSHSARRVRAGLRRPPAWPRGG
jgi:hypothetical protein